MRRTYLVVVGLLVVIAVLAIASHFVHRSAPLPQRASKILILKSAHELRLLDSGNRILRAYSIAIGRGGLEPKQQQGDHKSPEGLYVIDWHRHDSRFHRALHVSYPNQADRQRAEQRGVDAGGDIMIHGIQNGIGWLGSTHRVVDWTDGCFAVTDAEIEEIYASVPDGTPVEIRH